MGGIRPILTCLYVYLGLYRPRIEYFGKFRKNRSPENNPTLGTTKNRGCAVKLNYDTASCFVYAFVLRRGKAT
ncbi:hypothetical protein, partial [Parabacteroides sp.]